MTNHKLALSLAAVLASATMLAAAPIRVHASPSEVVQADTIALVDAETRDDDENLATAVDTIVAPQEAPDAVFADVIAPVAGVDVFPVDPQYVSGERDGDTEEADDQAVVGHVVPQVAPAYDAAQTSVGREHDEESSTDAGGDEHGD
ncbi:MAG: hypothetical protein NVS1B2_05800 [Vulcanimicrobiaceae bacterium]